MNRTPLAAATGLLALALAAPAAAQTSTPEPAVQRQVIEDDGVRIEELRVRGQTQRIVVQSKLGNVRPYEIRPPAPGRDPQDDRGAGQRVWRLFSF